VNQEGAGKRHHAGRGIRLAGWGLLGYPLCLMDDFVKPEVILTHESDLDGLVSGLLLQRLARQVYGVRVPLQAYHNHQWRQRPMLEPAAWVCDLAFDSRLDRPNWLVVDHHATEIVPRQARLIHDVNKSAGRLCYELCQDRGLGTPALDRLVRLNDIADLFLVEDPEFAAASDCASLVKSYGFWAMHALIEGDLERLLDHPLLEVMAVKRRVEDPLGEVWSGANVVPLSADVGFVPTLVGNTNLIVHRLLAAGGLPYRVLLTLFRKANGTVIVSLRSRNGEALALATRLQGGGHANAAGATLPRSVQQIPDAIHYLRKVLNPAPASPPPAGPEGSLLRELEAS